MKVMNPDSLELVPGEELLERQRATGEIGAGHEVVCRPDLKDPKVVQVANRAMCLAAPYQACEFCRHSRFELVFSKPPEDWVQCPRWHKEIVGPPAFYTPAWMSECSAKPHPFCAQCPSREELHQLSTDKKKEGWLERYWKLTR